MSSSNEPISMEKEAHERALETGKDETRILGGMKAAETRKDREGDDAFVRLGEKGGNAPRKDSPKDSSRH